MNKCFLFILILLCLGTPLAAQPWLDLLPKNKSQKDLTLFDYSQAFDNYWASYNVQDGYYYVEGEKVKAPGWKSFHRWEYMMSLKADPITGKLPNQSAYQIVKAYEADHPQPRTHDLSEWTSLGPFAAEPTYSGIGRINCIAFHPTDPDTYWAGAPSGGLWVTQDNGQTWTCLTDQNESLGVTDILVSPDYDTDATIYIATGDRDSYDNQSIGVLVTHDGGTTWQPTDLTFSLTSLRHITRLLRHPSNPQMIYAATGDGVYRTTDGGTTWDELLTDLEFIDMEFHPTQPDTIYGSTDDGQIYRTLNGGDTWNRIYYYSQSGRTELAVSPAQPEWLYAVMSTGGLRGFFKSEDHGDSFTLLVNGDTLNLLGWNADGSGTGGQGYYDLALAASPFDALEVFLGGINTWKSNDGGTTWAISNLGGNHPTADHSHSDKHALTFRADGTLFEGNDGGIYTTSDHGENWKDITGGMAISQMYRLAVSQSEKDIMLAGLQDNGTKMNSPLMWADVTGADGMTCMIDPANADVQYSTSQNGTIFRTLDRWKTLRYIMPNAGTGNWVTPYAMDPQNSNILYAGFKEIWRTTDRGDNWAQVSSVNENSKFRVITVAPSDPAIVYAAGPYNFYKANSPGGSFLKLTAHLPNQSNSISDIAVKADDPNTLWATSSGFFDPGVFVSNNGGESWKTLMAGLPPIPVYTIVQNAQVTDRVDLYAGTELGVYYKAGDADWVPFKNGLPNVIVMDLAFYYDGNPTLSLLRAATYGRGMWETRVSFDSSPMTFVSSTTSHPTLDPIRPGYSNQEMLKIEIQTAGDLAPLHATAFTFSTEGSTDPFTDLEEARLFYSGNINGFLTTIPFGEAVSHPDGTFSITGDQPLGSGVNYFWLAYSLPFSATEANILDASCTTIGLGMDVTPDITSPDSSRQIQVVYCDAGSTHLGTEYISKVTIGDIEQSSVKGQDGYEDYTHLMYPAMAGKPFQVTVTNPSPHDWDALLIWIDYNRDGDFEDEGESVYSSGAGYISQYSVDITPPLDLDEDFTLIRIRLHDSSFGPNFTSCGNANLGEVEDYGISIRPDEMTGTVQLNAQDQVMVYPNPFSGIVNLHSKQGSAPKAFSITDLTGRLVFDGILTDQVILDASDWAPGMYLLSWHDLVHGQQMLVRIGK